jgi:hypothetical protein
MFEHIVLHETLFLTVSCQFHLWDRFYEYLACLLFSCSTSLSVNLEVAKPLAVVAVAHLKFMQNG